jgi:hypothetical protein
MFKKKNGRWLSRKKGIGIHATVYFSLEGGLCREFLPAKTYFCLRRKETIRPAEGAVRKKAVFS